MKTIFTFFIILLVIIWAGITNVNGQTQLYGMTQYGGTNNLGTIFHYTPSTGAHTLDISLPWNYADEGGSPQYDNGLTDGGDGYFYGMTAYGGISYYGVIFQWDPVSNTFTKKFDFLLATGDTPNGSLTLNGGKFYGMTTNGGANGYGVIFEWNPLTNAYIDKYDFDGTNGSKPYGSLTLSGGKFYGMTNSGGAFGKGVIFEWDPLTLTYIDKYDFDGTNGATPYGNLTLYGGKFYGMTRNGGAFGPAPGYGVIFEWDPATGYSKKYDFDGTNGRNPFGSLTLKGDKFYGMTVGGGANNLAVIFEWDPLTNAYVDKYDFNGTNGKNPRGSLTLSGGKFYGMTFYGGAFGGTLGCGVVFEWDPGTNLYTKLVDFDETNGWRPWGSLTLKGGKLYGMTSQGGTKNIGIIFELDPVAPLYTKKIDFTLSSNPNITCGSVTRKGDKFYGMSYGGGANNLGVIFEYDPATNIITGKFDFFNITGTHPLGSLTLVDGKFYGMTYEGGAYSWYGVIFEWDPGTNLYTKLVDFDGSNGAYPHGNLTLYNGKLYGMATQGGANNYGVIFELDLATLAFTKIWDFDGVTGRDGYGSLTVGGDKLYGMANQGGAYGYGVIFELDPATNSYTVKVDFDGTNNGRYPQSTLTLSNGKFYGTTLSGGPGGGVLFDWDPLSNILTPDINLDDPTGYGPYGSLTMSNGKFYGMTGFGGAFGYGVIFEWDPVANTYFDKFDFDGTNGANPYYTTLLKYTPPATWTGAVNSDWATAGNWSSGAIPTSSANVFIPDVANDPVIGSGTQAQSYDLLIDALAKLTISSGGSLSMNGTLTNAAGDAGFVIESGASFKNHTVGANGQAMRTIDKDNKWHFLSSPVVQTTMPEICDGNFAPVTSNFNPSTGPTYDFFYWNETTPATDANWINLKNADGNVNTVDFGSPPRFVKGKGYLAEYSSAFAGSDVKTFSGTLGVGNIDIPVTNSAGGNSYNLIGNGYPSYIDWKIFGWDRTPLEDDAGGKNVWIWNGSAGNYGVYNSASLGDAGTNGVTRYIAPEQGFFVKASADGNVTMTDDVRCHSTEPWLKSVSNDLRLTVSTSMNAYSDEVMLEFGHQVTGGAEKWFSIYSEAPSLFLPVGEDIYSLRFLNDISENPVIPMSFKAGQNGNYSITAIGTEDFTNVILQDLKTGTSQDMKNNPVYNFKSATADDAGRFLLKFNAVGLETMETGNNGIFIYNNTLCISNPGEGVIEVFNMMGQKLLTEKTHNEALYQLKIEAPTGYYIVRLTTGQKVYTEKIFVK